jgi:hypothetical protein
MPCSCYCRVEQTSLVPFDETGCMASAKLPHTDPLIALVVLAAYQQLLPVVGLRPLLLLNVMFAALGVLFSAVFCKNHYSFAGNRLTLSSQLTSSLDRLCNTFNIHFRPNWWRRYCSGHDIYDLYRHDFTTRPTVWRNSCHSSKPELMYHLGRTHTTISAHYIFWLPSPAPQLAPCF